MLFEPDPQHRPRLRLAVCASTLLLGLTGCATAPPAAPSASAQPVAAPAQPSLQELMQQAQSAQRDGQRERARQSWRAAAKAYPTDKSPWQRLAESYFDSADYGNAILAAQEVLQRDDQDTLAHSVLAVSGLRLSTVSLVALRERTSYPVGSREEAQGLTRAMRDALGEVALVPQRTVEPAAAAARAPAPAPTARVAAPVTRPLAAPGAPTPPRTAAATAPAAPAPKATVVPVVNTAPAPAPAKPAGDPFKLLK